MLSVTSSRRVGTAACSRASGPGTGWRSSARDRSGSWPLTAPSSCGRRRSGPSTRRRTASTSPGRSGPSRSTSPQATPPRASSMRRGGRGIDRGIESVGYRAHDLSGDEHPEMVLDNLVKVVRSTAASASSASTCPRTPVPPATWPSRAGSRSTEACSSPAPTPWDRADARQAVQPGPARPHRRGQGPPLFHRLPRVAARRWARCLPPLRQARGGLDQGGPAPGFVGTPPASIAGRWGTSRGPADPAAQVALEIQPLPPQLGRFRFGRPGSRRFTS